MFFHKRVQQKYYDKQNKIPAVRSSICTGEKVAGFKDKTTGHFEEIMLIRTDADLAEFKKMYGVDEVATIY